VVDIHMYPLVDSLRFNVYVGSRANRYFDSRLYFGSVIGAEISSQYYFEINLNPDSPFVIVSSLKRLDNL
jgi:hypothetical protein